MKRVWVWLQGKKTVIVSVATVVVTAAGFWYGKITVAQAIQLVSFAGVAVGLGDKLQRYLPQIGTGIATLATAMADFKAGQVAAGVSALAGEAAQLAPAIESGLHITGDPAHVAAVVDAVTSPAASNFIQIPPTVGALQAMPGADGGFTLQTSSVAMAGAKQGGGA